MVKFRRQDGSIVDVHPSKIEKFKLEYPSAIIVEEEVISTLGDEVQVDEVQTPPSLDSDAVNLLDKKTPATGLSRANILTGTKPEKSTFETVNINKPRISREEFDNISEEDLVETLQPQYRKLGYEIKPASIGEDAISVTNIATDETIEIPLNTDYNKEKMESRRLTAEGQNQPNFPVDPSLNSTAYNTFIDFTSSKVNENEANTYALTGVKPSEYFREGERKTIYSLLHNRELDAEEMNKLVHSGKNHFIEAFKDPTLANLEMGKNAAYSAAADYDDEQIAKIQDYAYEQTVKETGLNISKDDFDMMFDKDNIKGNFKFEAIDQQTISNNIKLAANNDPKKTTQLKNTILKNKTDKRNPFDQAAFSLINGSKIDGIETDGLYTVEDKIKTIEDNIKRGAPDKSDNPTAWLEAQQNDLEKLRVLENSIKKDLTTNAKAAAEHFAKHEATKRIMSSPYYASRGELNFTDPEYKKDYDKYFKEYSSKNFINGVSASDRQKIREQNNSTSYNEGFKTTINNLATNINELARENPSLTEREGKEELMNINVRRLSHILESGKQTVTLKAKEIIGGDDRLPLEKLRQAGYMPNENGEIVIPMNVLMGIKAKSGEIGKEIMGYQSFEGWFDKFFLERGDAINKEDLNALKMHARNLENVNGSMDALYETLYLNKDIADLEKTGKGEIFLRAAAKETLKTFGYSGEKVNRMFESSEGKLDTRTLFDHVSKVSGEYNSHFAELIKDGTLPPAQFTEDQIKQVERTFGEEFVEMAGGFVPLMGQIMALSAASGGAMNILGAAKWMQTALKSGNGWDKIRAYALVMGVEEGKMQLLGFPTGTGAIFGGIGTATRALTPFGKHLTTLDPWYNNFVKAPLVGAFSAEVAEVGHKAIQALKDDANFMTEFDALYEDGDEVIKRVMLNVALFASGSIPHVKAFDFMGVNSKIKARDYNEAKMNELLGEGKTEIDLDGTQRFTRKSYNDLTIAEQKKYNAYNEAAATLDIMINKDAGQGINFNLSTKEFEKEMTNKLLKPQIKSLKNQGIEVGEAEIKVIETKDRDKYFKKGSTNPAEWHYDGKKNVMVFDKTRAKAEIDAGLYTDMLDLYLHESSHMVGEAYLRKFPKAEENFAEDLLQSFDKLNDPFGGMTPKQLEIFINKKYLKEIKDKDGKSGIEVNPNLTAKEAIAFVAQFAARKEAYYKNNAPTFVHEILEFSKKMLIDAGLKDVPIPQNAAQFYKFLAAMGRDIRKGTASDFQYSIFANLEDVEFLQYSITEKSGKTNSKTAVNFKSESLESVQKEVLEINKKATDKVFEDIPGEKGVDKARNEKAFNRAFTQGFLNNSLQTEFAGIKKLPGVTNKTFEDFKHSMYIELKKHALNFNSNNDSFFGWLVSQKRHKRGNILKSKENPLGIKPKFEGDSTLIKDLIEEGSESSKTPTAEIKQIDAIDLIRNSKLSPEAKKALLDKTTTQTLEAFEKFDGELSFRGLKDLNAEAIGELFGVNPRAIIDFQTKNFPKGKYAKTLTKADANNAQRFVMTNWSSLMKGLPTGNVKDIKGKPLAIAENLLNTPTGLSRNIQKAFYDKVLNSKGDQVRKKVPGITKEVPQWKIKPLFRNVKSSEARNAFLKEFGIEYDKKSKTFATRTPNAQTLKGLMELVDRNIKSKIIRNNLEFKKVAKEKIDALAAGQSKWMNAESLAELKGIAKEIKEAIDAENIYDAPTLARIIANLYISESQKERFYEVLKGMPKEKEALKLVEQMKKLEELLAKELDMSPEELKDTEKVSAKNIAILAKSLGLDPSRVAYGEANKLGNEKLREEQTAFEKEVIKRMAALSGLSSQQVNSILTTFGFGSKSKKSGDANINTGTNKEVFVEEYYGEGMYDIGGKKLTEKEINEREAFYIPDWAVVKKNITKEQYRLNDLIKSRKITTEQARQELNIFASKALTKNGKNPLTGKSYTYAETAVANKLMAKDFIMSMFDVVKAAKGPKAKKAAREMMLLTFGMQTNIAKGLIKSAFPVRAIALKGSKPKKIISEKTGKESWSPENHWEHALQLINFTDFINRTVKKGKSRKSFETTLDLLLDNSYQDLIPKELQKFNDSKEQGGPTGYSPNMGNLANILSNWDLNIYKKYSEVKNQIMLSEPGKATDLAQEIAYKLRKINEKELKDYLNSIPENKITTEQVLLKDIVNNKKSYDEVRNINTKIGKKGDIEITKKMTNSEVFDKFKEKDKEISSKKKESFKSESLSKEFNLILENSTGIGREKRYSDIRAKALGANKRNWQLFIPDRAADLNGLLDVTLAAGKVGNKQRAWYKKNIIDPFNNAENILIRDRVTLTSGFKALKKQLKITPKDLRKEALDGFTFEQAIRVHTWNKQGMKIEGLSKRDLKDLSNIIEKNPELDAFSDKLIELNKGEGYPAPHVEWLAGSIATDLRTSLNKKGRAKYLEATGYTQNINKIYSKENLNKLEAVYGYKYRVALENMLLRMKTGTNRKPSSNALENRALDWINNANGVTMFLNTRSAVLQTISAANFINWTDNNPLKVAKALANPKQYSKDFMDLMNSDYLVDRRNGLKLNVSESEIADAAKGGANSAKGMINYLLSKGFILTRIADSFAIASGGATFYRNRINTYKKQGFLEKEAKEKAFNDFKEISEESQQSANVSKISMEQSSALGRLVLAFANTPMQYTRLQKRAILDLANGRGDYKTNISKIMYYGFVQNLMFNALQNAMFTDIWETDEDAKNKTKQRKKEDRNVRIANGMLDSTLRGMGIGGAAVSTLKNVLLKIKSEANRSNPEYKEAVMEVFDFLPPIDSKFKKLRSAAEAFEYDRIKQMKKMGLMDIDNPAYLASANIISAATNFPADRIIKKVSNMNGIMTDEMEMWQRISRFGGWDQWQIGPFTNINKKSTYKSKFSTSSFSTPNFSKMKF
jgi:hypothetical protein